MKRITLLLSILFFGILNTARASAVTTTPTPTTKITTTPSPVEKEKTTEVLNDLKERIASRVAQLKLVEKRGVIGSVTQSTDTQITLTDKKGNKRLIDVDELTRFSSPGTKGSFGISDISKGMQLDVLGLYNKQSRRILARFITVVTNPLYVHGTISSIDDDDFVIEVASEDGKTRIVDIETVTKTLAYSKEAGLGKSGFSKITTGQHVIVIGFPNKKDAKRIIASRILIFPDIPKNPRIIIPQPALDEETTTVPSTGSGKKITPLSR